MLTPELKAKSKENANLILRKQWKLTKSENQNNNVHLENSLHQKYLVNVLVFVNLSEFVDTISTTTFMLAQYIQ